MIFIINETTEKLQLKATKLNSTTTSLSVLTADADLPILSTEDEEVAEVLLDRYEQPEEIRNLKSRHNIYVSGSRLFIDQYDENADPGLSGTCKVISAKTSAEYPSLYATSKDIVVIIHPHDVSVDIDPQNLTHKNMINAVSERGEIEATILPIKWYNWSKLINPVIIYMDDDAAYQLSSMPHKKNEDRMVNAVKSIRKQKR